MNDLTTDPVTVLLERQRAIADRAAMRGIEARRLAAQLTDLRTELADLNAAARATDALLRIHAAVAARNTTKPEPATKPRKAKP